MLYLVSLQIELHFDVFELDIVLCHISHQTEFAHAAQRTGRKVDMDETTELAHIDALVLDVGKLTLFGFVVSMGNVVTHERGFTGKCTFAGHFKLLLITLVSRPYGDVKK